ncbi:TPA: hypothetical protein NKB38_004525 [Vibrio parahaemolyticus]|nr:hypothetical protein [Vibrio parahaemolyticus]
MSDKNANVPAVLGDPARVAEHRCLSALSTHAVNTESLEITRPSVTNCPDGGHDLGITGKVEEVLSVVSTLTETPIEELQFLNSSAKKGKLTVRVDVKNVETITGDTIDVHTKHSTQSPHCQVNLIMPTNPEVIITPAAQEKLEKQAALFKEDGVLMGITTVNGLEQIESNNQNVICNTGDK